MFGLLSCVTELPPCGAMRVVRQCAHDPMCVTDTSRACLALLLLLMVVFKEDGYRCSMNFGRTV